MRKEKRFEWDKEQELAIEGLKVVLQSPPMLRQVDYNYRRPVIVTIDVSPIAIGWTIGQDDKEDNQFAIRFEKRILIERQRDYPKVKRKSFGVHLLY